MRISFGHKDAHDPPYPPEMLEVRAEVEAACDENCRQTQALPVRRHQEPPR